VSSFSEENFPWFIPNGVTIVPGDESLAGSAGSVGIDLLSATSGHVAAFTSFTDGTAFIVEVNNSLVEVARHPIDLPADCTSPGHARLAYPDPADAIDVRVAITCNDSADIVTETVTLTDVGD
jgi:hypothetical protein